MRALRAALRRDLARLRDAAGRLDGSAGAPSAVLVGWDAFRAQLENHHSAEDDDLWPVLRRELSEPGELASVDAMVEEHRHIPPALAAVDVALRGGGDPPASAERLSAVVLDHLAHEEREVLPLLEQHLTPAQWRAFLRKERNRDRICRIEGVKCAFDYDAAGAPEPLTPRGARRNVPPNRMFGTSRSFRDEAELSRCGWR